MAWNKRGRSWILIFAAILAVYGGSLSRNANERAKRSLQLTDETSDADRVLILVVVTSINPSARQLTALLDFRFIGNIAKDDVTPRVNMKLLVNNIGGQQEFNFPKGERMHRIDVTFPMDGDMNKYPLDHYVSALRFLMIMPGKASQRVTPNARQNTPGKTIPSEMPQGPLETPEATAQAGELVVGESELQDNVPVPISISLTASVPGAKFSGGLSREENSKLTNIALDIRRPDNLITVAFFVMVMMMSLATSVLVMAIKTTTIAKTFDLLPLSLSLSLIFGLPALRNIQPGVPPIGAMGDYFSFIWAELFVAASAIIIMWTWLMRSEPI